MLAQIPIATRQLAKRQITWLRSWPAVNRLDSQASDLHNSLIELVKINSSEFL
jgi:tRNA dimethylallyltransferase